MECNNVILLSDRPVEIGRMKSKNNHKDHIQQSNQETSRYSIRQKVLKEGYTPVDWAYKLTHNLIILKG